MGIWVKSEGRVLSSVEFDKLFPPPKARTHKAAVDRANAGKSEEELRRQSCARARERNATRKKERREIARVRNTSWECLSITDKLKALDRRPGNCKRQKDRLTARTGGTPEGMKDENYLRS